MPLLDRHARRRIRNAVAGRLGPLLLRLWYSSLRVRLVNCRREGAINLPPERGIFIFWHQNLLLPTMVFRRSGIRVLISDHADGEMIARIVQGMGMEPVRGSTTRGGARAVVEMLREDAARSPRLFYCFTPDGPKGPAHVVQPGVVYLASRTGLPLYPVAVESRGRWELRSWDRFRLPRPFGRGLIRVPAAPIIVPPDLDRDGLEEQRRITENALLELGRETAERFEELYAAALPPRRQPRFSD